MLLLQQRSFWVLMALGVFGVGAMSFVPNTDNASSDTPWSLGGEEQAQLLVLRSEGSEISMKKGEGGVWRSASDTRIRMEKRRVDVAIATLAQAEPINVLLPLENTSQYGLDSNQGVEILLSDAAGMEVQLKLGRQSSKPGYWYAKTVANELVLVQGDFDFIHHTLDEWRDWRVFNFNPSAVTQFTLTSPGGQLTVAEKSLGEWEVVNYGVADIDAVEETIVGFLQMRFQALSSAEDEKLDPYMRAVIVFEDGSEHRLEVSHLTAVRASVRVDSGMVGEVPAQELAFMSQGPTDFGISRQRAMEVLGITSDQKPTEDKKQE